MRTTIHPYLSFNGNCREAMLFYQECLGGKLNIETIGNYPDAEKMPQYMKDAVLQATLVKENFLLMASDMVGEEGLTRGNAIILMLHCASEKEINHCYRELSAGGLQIQPVRPGAGGTFSGNLKDKFGHEWFLYYQQK